MGFVTSRVRRVVVLLAVFAPVAAVQAQVAIQVKSGTTWTASLELRSVGPITFRWRWDGADTPTGVAWQLATATPTSTATNRSADVVASDTPMRLPASSGVKGGYEEFTVTPASSWPAKFYVRMRVTTGRSTVYSRWVPITVVQRAALDVVLVNPTCTVEAFKYRKGIFSSTTVKITLGEIVDDDEWPEQRVLIRITNRVATGSVSYRLKLNFSNYTNPIDPTKMVREVADGFLDAAKIQTTAASATETLRFFLMKSYSFEDNKLESIEPLKGVLRFEASTTPVSGPGSNCSFIFTVK
jgi:hypothetical protein